MTGDRSPTAETKLAAVIGDPVRHSLSPTLHNAAFAASGANWVFVALHVHAGHGAAAIDAMRVLGLDGLAVTMPHKEVVAAAVDEVDDAAAALGSVNTVVRRADGSLLGTSTDGDGFVASLSEAGVEVRGRAVAVAGAGAAARSVVEALARAGAADIAIVNRTPERAQRAASLATAARLGQPGDIERADIVVNATSVGMGTPETPFDLDLLGPEQVVADLVYHPIETALLAGARVRGCEVVDGLGMLVHQAALQQRWWTGNHPDTAIMRATAEAVLAARAGRR